MTPEGHAKYRIITGGPLRPDEKPPRRAGCLRAVEEPLLFCTLSLGCVPSPCYIPPLTRKRDSYPNGQRLAMRGSVELRLSES